MNDTPKQELKPFLRVLATDLDGNKPMVQALTKVRGVSFSLAHIICNVLQFPKDQKAGYFTPEETKKIESLLKTKGVLPVWLVNRRKDFESGEDVHVTGADLKLSLEFDLKRLKRMRCYRGMRHAIAQPVRGQRTRSHFRKGRAVGVIKTKIAKVAAATKDAAAEKKK